MKKIFLLSLFFIFLNPIKSNEIDYKRDQITTEQPSETNYSAWCGLIGKAEKVKDRPICNIQFKNNNLIIDDLLVISREQLRHIKFDRVCRNYKDWHECETLKFLGPSPLEAFGDKRYKVYYVLTNGVEKEAIISFRNRKTNANFRRDIELWFGKPITDIGPTIKHYSY